MREVFGETSGEGTLHCAALGWSRILLPRLEARLNGEAKELDRDFLGEEPFSVLADPLRFLDLGVSSGMNRLSESLDCRD